MVFDGGGFNGVSRVFCEVYSFRPTGIEMSFSKKGH